jgi:hypothetical protein
MRDLVLELLPHAPRLGLHLSPQIPDDKLRRAVRDYARDVDPASVLALYDATRLGSAKDGALFLEDRFVFQNHALQDALSVRYEDVVRVEEKRQLLGGRRVEIDVNRGRATVTETIDFSAHADAAEYVARLLKEAMLRPPSPSKPEQATTDLGAVEAALADLERNGLLSAEDRRAMRAAIGR